MVHVHNSDQPASGRGLIRLAPGIKLSSESSTATLSVLSAGKVHLNQNALAILELCDGSRSRDRVVVDAVLRSAGSMRAADVAEFLDAAQARGWIMEVE
jgi:hypothetical protein